mmetsp:Transcript_14081/g.28772  ORF Transcript_14081/g.28772 Transcript_14081/m.28772 type:complete len:257 (+) Transcript_14081:1873-2643(+)
MRLRDPLSKGMGGREVGKSKGGRVFFRVSSSRLSILAWARARCKNPGPGSEDRREKRMRPPADSDMRSISGARSPTEEGSLDLDCLRPPPPVLEPLDPLFLAPSAIFSFSFSFFLFFFHRTLLLVLSLILGRLPKQLIRGNTLRLRAGGDSRPPVSRNVAALRNLLVHQTHAFGRLVDDGFAVSSAPFSGGGGSDASRRRRGGLRRRGWFLVAGGRSMGGGAADGRGGDAGGRRGGRFRVSFGARAARCADGDDGR